MQPHHRAHAGGGHGIGGLGIRKNIGWNSSRKSGGIASGKWKYLNYDGFRDSARPIEGNHTDAIARKNSMSFCLVSGASIPAGTPTDAVAASGVRVAPN